ncbi:MAG: hypothetical protein [Bacteriophage sp.]|nr:MAG: hypothetical protein [Bacteriophage sp.]
MLHLGSFEQAQMLSICKRFLGVQQRGRVLNVVPMGMSLSNSSRQGWKTEKSSVGWSLVGTSCQPNKSDPEKLKAK